MKVYVHPVLSEQERSYFTQALESAVTLVFNDGSNDAHRAENADIAIGNFDTDWIGNMVQLKVILLDSVGTDNFNGYQWPQGSQVTVHNLNDFFSVPVAEEAVASLLSVYRQLPALNCAQRESLWAKDQIRMTKRLLAESKVLLVGYGNIAQRIEHLLTPFGCEIEKFDRKDMALIGREGLKGKVSAHDITISTIPATEESFELFDDELFRAMPDNAVFMNLGRGNVVDEDALVRKATQNKAFNACLDVTKQEPLPASSALWQLPNVWLTQHTGGGCETENYKKIDVYTRQIQRLLAGLPLNNQVQF